MTAICHKHNITSEDERWKVLMEELMPTEDQDTEGEDERQESFREQICPQCYIALKERLKEAKRNLKVESRQAIHLRAENDRLQGILDAVMTTVKTLSGKDPVELSKKTYRRFPGIPYDHSEEHGDIANILPNLIVELANQGKKP